MKNLKDYLFNEAKTSNSVLEKNDEVVDILNGIEYDKTGVTLEDVKKYLKDNSPLNQSQVNKLFSINKFKSDKNVTYKFGECAECTGDFNEYLADYDLLEGDVYLWKGDEDDPDYFGSSYMTDNLFIVYGASCMGDDESIIIVSETI